LNSTSTRPVQRSLDVRARPSEVGRVLPRAARGELGERGAVGAQRRVRQLRVAAARHELLHHHDVGRDERARLVVPAQQLGARVDPPRLRRRQPVELLLDRRLEHDGVADLARGEVRAVARVRGPRRGEPERRGERVRQALVVGEAHRRPRRHGHGEPLRQRVVVTGREGGRLVARRDEREALRTGGRRAEEVGEPVAGIAGRPVEAALRVPRARREDVVAVADHPDRHAPPPQAADDPERAVVGAEDERTPRRRDPRRCEARAVRDRDRVSRHASRRCRG
jgi:hypothetical protein